MGGRGLFGKIVSWNTKFDPQCQVYNPKNEKTHWKLAGCVFVCVCVSWICVQQLGVDARDHKRSPNLFVSHGGVRKKGKQIMSEKAKVSGK